MTGLHTAVKSRGRGLRTDREARVLADQPRSGHEDLDERPLAHAPLQRTEAHGPLSRGDAPLDALLRAAAAAAEDLHGGASWRDHREQADSHRPAQDQAAD